MPMEQMKEVSLQSADDDGGGWDFGGCEKRLPRNGNLLRCGRWAAIYTCDSQPPESAAGP